MAGLGALALGAGGAISGIPLNGQAATAQGTAAINSQGLLGQHFEFVYFNVVLWPRCLLMLHVFL